MTAETVYNVIQALPDKERPRLKRMLEADELKTCPKAPEQTVTLLSGSDATDYLLKMLSKKKI